MPFDRIGQEIVQFLAYFSQRQQVVASNIANADTPGYRTRDLARPDTFANAFGEALQSSFEVPGLAVRNDGNNVSIDREARLLAENAAKFNLATQLLRGELRGVRAAIEEGRSS